MAGDRNELIFEDVNLVEDEVEGIAGSTATNSQIASTAVPERIARETLSAAAGKALAPDAGDDAGVLNAAANSNEAAGPSLADLLAGPDLDIVTAAGGQPAGQAGAGAANNGGVFTDFNPLSGLGGFNAIGGLEGTSLNYGLIERESRADETGLENGEVAGLTIPGSGGDTGGNAGGAGNSGAALGTSGGSGGSGTSGDVDGSGSGSGTSGGVGGSGSGSGTSGGVGGSNGPNGLPSHQDNGHGNNAGQSDNSNPGQGGGNHGAFAGLDVTDLQSLYSHRVDNNTSPLDNTIHLEIDSQSTSLHLSPKDVLNFADGSNELFITGDSNDTVFLTGNWTFQNSNVQAPDGHHYDVFQSTASGQTVTVFVDLNMSMPGIESSDSATPI